MYLLNAWPIPLILNEPDGCELSILSQTLALSLLPTERDSIKGELICNCLFTKGYTF